MIIMPGNVKICSINDSFMMNQSFVDSVFQEHVKYFIFKSLQGCTEFKNNINPIRVESSMSMIKRIVAPGSQVFKSTYPMGVMAAEETEDEDIGALISPQNKYMRNKYIPQELTTEPIIKRMKTFDIKNNVDIRVGFTSSVYNIGFVFYDETRQKCYNTKKKWDIKIEPGKFHTEYIRMTTIIPKDFIYKYCIYEGVDYNLNWFVDKMNTTANTNLIFELGVDPGTKLNEVFMHYPVKALWRATTTTPPEREEAGDVEKHWTVSRTFLMSVNMPTVLYFGRERDADLPDYIPSLSKPLENVMDNPRAKDTVTTVPAENVATISKEVQFTTVDDYEGYTHIATYDFSKDDFEYLRDNNLNTFDVTIFDNIIPPNLEESIFYHYCKSLKILLASTDNPIKIVFKLNNAIVEYPVADINDLYKFTINNVKDIVTVGKFSIIIYYHTRIYREFIATKQEPIINMNTSHIKY